MDFGYGMQIQNTERYNMVNVSNIMVVRLVVEEKIGKEAAEICNFYRQSSINRGYVRHSRGFLWGLRYIDFR